MNFTIHSKSINLILLSVLQFIVFINISYSSSISTSIIKKQPGFIDEHHGAISNTIINWFDSIDKKFSDWIFDADKDVHKKGTETINKTKDMQNSIDSFFQNEKFLEESDDAYILLRVNNHFSSTEDEEYKLKARAQIPLSQTRKKLKLFIEPIKIS
jgi:hypothetical protein